MISKGKFFGILFFFVYLILTYISLHDNIIGFFGGTQQTVKKSLYINDSKFVFIVKKDDKNDEIVKKIQNQNKKKYNWDNGYSYNLLSLKPNVKPNLSLYSNKTNSTTGLTSYLSANYKVQPLVNRYKTANNANVWNNHYESGTYSSSAANSLNQSKCISNGNHIAGHLYFNNQLIGLNRFNSDNLKEILLNKEISNIGFKAINTDVSAIESSFQNIEGNMQRVSSDIDPGDGDGDMGNPIPVGDGEKIILTLALVYGVLKRSFFMKS